MKYKFALIICFLMMMIGVVSAMCPTDVSKLGTFKQGTNINLSQICDTCSYVTLDSIMYPNSSKLYIDTNMTKNGRIYDYPFYIETNGDYFYYVAGDKDGTLQSETICFEVTPSGSIFNISTSILSIFILAILIGLLIFSTKGMFKAEEGGWQIFYICISYILLFSVFFLFWIFSKNYLFDIPILSSVFWVIWLILSVMFLPFLIIVSAYILKNQAEALMEGDYVKQGYTRSEAQEMSKKHKR